MHVIGRVMCANTWGSPSGESACPRVGHLLLAALSNPAGASLDGFRGGRGRDGKHQRTGAQWDAFNHPIQTHDHSDALALCEPRRHCESASKAGASKSSLALTRLTQTVTNLVLGRAQSGALEFNSTQSVPLSSSSHSSNGYIIHQPLGPQTGASRLKGPASANSKRPKPQTGFRAQAAPVWLARFSGEAASNVLFPPELSIWLQSSLRLAAGG